jgi:hypothetical protein
MRNPARQEQCRLGHIARIKSARGEEIARVIEGHHDHDQATQKINGVQPNTTGRRVRFGDPMFSKDHATGYEARTSKCFQRQIHKKPFPQLIMRTCVT